MLINPKKINTYVSDQPNDVNFKTLVYLRKKITVKCICIDLYTINVYVSVKCEEFNRWLTLFFFRTKPGEHHDIWKSECVFGLFWIVCTKLTLTCLQITKFWWHNENGCKKWSAFLS